MASTTRTWSRKGRASRHGRQRIVQQALSMRGAQVRATATATVIGAWSKAATATGVTAIQQNRHLRLRPRLENNQQE